MSNAITISANVNAYNTSSDWLSNDELLSRAAEVANGGDRSAESVLCTMHLTLSDMSTVEGWSLIGTAKVEVTFLPREKMVAEELKGLQAQLDHARAEWLTKQQAILERISKLQALDYVDAAA